MTQFTHIFTIIPFPLRALRTDPRGPAPCLPSETAEDVEQLHGQAPAAARPREHRAAGARGADGRTSADDCCILYNVYIYIFWWYILIIGIYIYIFIYGHIYICIMYCMFLLLLLLLLCFLVCMISCGISMVQAASSNRETRCQIIAIAAADLAKS